MRYLLLLFHLVMVSMIQAQSLEALEMDLQRTYITDIKKVKEKALRIYAIDPLNETATRSLTTAFKHSQNYDSIDTLYAKLKKANPASAAPYLMRAKFQYYPISAVDTQILAELKMAIALDSTNFEANELLGQCYYTLFHGNPSTYYAAQCRAHLLTAFAAKKDASFYLKYPVAQTSHYLNDTAVLNTFKDMQDSVTGDAKGLAGTDFFYFPYDMFVEVTPGWEKDYTQNMFDKVNSASFLLSWYSGQLNAMEEPILHHDSRKTVFRFTWLRTFHNPVAIRIENSDGKCHLFWKACDGAGGYAPGNLITDENKPVSIEEWDKFMELLKIAGFWELPVQSHDMMGRDGSQWIIEGMQHGRYHVVDRWTPRNTAYEKCGSYLIDLTGLKIKKRNKY